MMACLKDTVVEGSAGARSLARGVSARLELLVLRREDALLPKAFFFRSSVSSTWKLLGMF